MARARMVVWYDRSAATNALVIGTSNKTEILLGYSTLFGDSASALNPLGDLYKTQVRQLSRAVGVPAPIIDKPPSADLWPGQTDESEMGLTYEHVDQLLYLLIDHRYTPDECVAAGFEQAFVTRVLTTIRRNQFKRMPPLIAKLSNRTIGYDFLYLRDWGT
jgi:NAD+ synthase